VIYIYEIHDTHKLLVSGPLLWVQLEDDLISVCRESGMLSLELCGHGIYIYFPIDQTIRFIDGISKDAHASMCVQPSI
jgi:hypothetical protein